jgi:hypothetical protein
MSWRRKPKQTTTPVSTGITAEAAHLANGNVMFKFWVNGKGVLWMWGHREYVPYHVTAVDRPPDQILYSGGDVETECRRRKQQIQDMLDKRAQRERDFTVVKVEPC